MTSVPQPTFGPTGFITPDESAILTGVETDFNAAFNNLLNMAGSTPQGQLCASMAAAIGNANDSFVFLSQQMDPAYNIGRYQDAIARIYFIERLPATPTTVTVTCGGGAGVTIPANALVVDDAGNQYSCVSAGTIPGTGTIALEFQCITLGPISCPAGSISTIFQAVNGWDSVINLTDGVIGQNTETQAAFEARRALSVAQNSQGSLPSVLGAVLNVEGVTDAFVTENVFQTPQLFRGYTLAPNSIFVSAVGGLDTAVAQALWTKKSPGCGYNGNTTVVVQDPNPAYVPPIPSYNVTFVRPTFETVTFIVTLSNNTLVPSTAATQVQNAIVNAFAGEDGGPRATLGSTIYASRFYGDIAALGNWVQIVNIKVGCSNLPSAVFTGSISGSTLTVTAIASGTIAIGQQITGGGVAAGTIITAGSGSSWTVSNSQTIASSTLQGVSAIYDDLSMDIDQMPVTAAGNIQLVLI